MAKSDLGERIGSIVKKYRKDMNINQDEMAERLGISRSTLSLIEQGQEPSLATLKNIVELTKMDPGELLEITRKRMIVVDTNIILQRPRILDQLCEEFDSVIIPQTVRDEINGLKDRGTPQQRKQASLCLGKMIELKDGGELSIVFDKGSGSHDDRIMKAATDTAAGSSDALVYLLTNDKDFLLKNTKGLTNFHVINSRRLDSMLNRDESYSVPLSQKFFDAVRRRNLDSAKKNYLPAVNVNYVDGRSGFTPLIQAVRNRDIPMVEYLISLPSTDINAVDRNKYMLPPLSHAVQARRIDMVELLVSNGADVNYPEKSNKNYYNTPLMIASWGGQLDIVKLLVENGACLNQVDKLNGFTSLIKAVFNSHRDVAEYLLSKGADTTICSFEGKKAVDYAYDRLSTEDGKAIYEMLKGNTK